MRRSRYSDKFIVIQRILVYLTPNKVIMKKTYALIITLLSITSVYAARLDKYTASNGITYHEGDSIQLAYGSAPDGSFNWVQLAGMAAVATYQQGKGAAQLNIGKNWAKYVFLIKKIKSLTHNGHTQYYFVVKGGAGANYNLFIEEAIDNCEIKDCKEQSAKNSEESSADELLKYKKLLDEGAITQEEYNAKKKQLLGL